MSRVGIHNGDLGNSAKLDYNTLQLSTSYNYPLRLGIKDGSQNMSSKPMRIGVHPFIYQLFWALMD